MHAQLNSIFGASVPAYPALPPMITSLFEAWCRLFEAWLDRFDCAFPTYPGGTNQRTVNALYTEPEESDRIIRSISV